MNKIVYVFLIIIALGISAFFAITESSAYAYYGAEDVYRVYLKGQSIGVIKNKAKLEKYINDQQEALKAKYGVDNVYIPNSLNIQSETTYNEKTQSVVKKQKK